MLLDVCGSFSVDRRITQQARTLGVAVRGSYALSTLTLPHNSNHRGFD